MFKGSKNTPFWEFWVTKIKRKTQLMEIFSTHTNQIDFCLVSCLFSSPSVSHCLYVVSFFFLQEFGSQPLLREHSQCLSILDSPSILVRNIYIYIYAKQSTLIVWDMVHIRMSTLWAIHETVFAPFSCSHTLASPPSLFLVSVWKSPTPLFHKPFMSITKMLG